MVKGLAQGYLAYLRLNGVGYKATKETKPSKKDPSKMIDVLILRLGKSHDDIYECTNVKVCCLWRASTYSIYYSFILNNNTTSEYV